MYFYVFLLIIIFAAIYLRFIRPWQLRWGATDLELARIMAGDEFVKSPTFNATRAVTIQAQPEHIFPWIVQMGICWSYSYCWNIVSASEQLEYV